MFTQKLLTTFNCRRFIFNRCKVIVRYNSQRRKLRVRFAPSPTGWLHLGGLRTALYNYLYAHANGGSFILRIEDTDQTRAVPGAIEKLQEVLVWTGLTPHEGPAVGGAYGPYIQSQRRHIYKKYTDILLEKGSAYPCFCSERRLELIRKEALRNRAMPKYDNQCRNLTIEEVREKQEKNIPHVIRFKMDSHEVCFTDLIYGELKQDPTETEGDPVIIKSDGFPTYHFANVVDDHLMEITHVLRGVEWHVSTTKHILLHKAFGWDPPQFAHLPLIINSDGSKLSKRQGDVHVEDYRTKGYFPEAVVNFVTYCGGGFGAMGKTQLNSLEELTRSFSLEKLNSNSGRLDFNRLEDLNRMAIEKRLASPATKSEIINRLRQAVQTTIDKNMKVVELSDDYLESVLNRNISRISLLEQLVDKDFLYLWIEPTHSLEQLKYENVTSDLLLACENVLEPLTSFNKSDILPVLRNIAEAKSMKFEVLMKILRFVTTGLQKGPPVAEVMEFLGKERTSKRIKCVCDLLTNK
ncbi:hypothetical protein CHUAL_009093 [Chamberlinius hualienensis]